MALTPKQQRFVGEYLVDLNATQAAVRAGYSEKTARAIGCENLTKPAIQEAIATAQRQLAEETGITARRVKEELARLAFVDMRGFFDTVGNLKPIYSLTEEQGAA